MADQDDSKAGQRQRAKGTGSVYQRGDGKWVAQVENGWTASGRRRYLRRTRPNESQAHQALGDLERTVARNLDPSEARQTLRSYLDGWLDGLEGTRAPKTVAAYRSDVAHVTALIGHVRLDRLTPKVLRQMMRALPARGIAPKSQLNVRTTLHTAIEQAVDDRILDWNPVSQVDRPRVQRYDADALSIDQARAVLAALADHRLYALYAVAVAVGLRQGEALGLTWKRVDFDQGVVQIRKQVRLEGEPRHRHYLLRDLKNPKRIRDVPLPGFALDVLRDHKVRQAQERLATGARWVDGCCDEHGCPGGTGWGLVFATCSHRSAGRPIHHTRALKLFQDVCVDAIGIRPRFHDLRHTAATLLLAQGVPLEQVQEILGHSSIQVTKDVYGHLEIEHLRGAATKMNDLFGS
jgi:integrase